MRSSIQTARLPSPRKNDAKLTLISADVGLGTGAAVAAGGTVAVLVNENATVAEAGRESAVTARDVRIEAASSDALLNILASASGAGTSSATAAGTIGVAITTSQTRAEALEGSSLTAESGHVRIHAKKRHAVHLRHAGSHGGQRRRRARRERQHAPV